MQLPSMLRRVLILSGIAFLGLGGGITVSRYAAPVHPTTPSATSRARLESGFYPGPPATLAELVQAADLIVIARVGELVQEGRFAGYNEQGQLVTAQAKGLPPQAEVPYYDYALHVEQSLKGLPNATPTERVILRTSVSAAEPIVEEHVEYPPALPGQRYLFFLTQNPDRTTYRLRYAWGSRLLIDGPIVTFSDGARTPVRFDREMSPAAFIRQLTTVIAAEARSTR